MRPIESHNRKNLRKNTVGPNEFTDFENFGFEHPGQFKMICHVNLIAHSKPSTIMSVRTACGDRIRKSENIMNSQPNTTHAKQTQHFMKTTFNQIVRTHFSAANSILTIPDAQNNYQFQKINIFKKFKKSNQNDHASPTLAHQNVIANEFMET